MEIRMPCQSKVFLMNKHGNLFDITSLTRECIIRLSVCDIVTCDCTLYEVDKKGSKVLTLDKKEISKYHQIFPLISAKINNRGTKIVLDSSGFISSSFLKPHIGFWNKILTALAKGFL